MSYEEAVTFAKDRLTEMLDTGLLKYADSVVRSEQLKVIDGNDVNWSKEVETAKTDPDKFEELLRYCSRHLRGNTQMQPVMQMWLCDYLDGLIKPPKKKGGAPNKPRGHEPFIKDLIDLVSKNFKLKIGRNHASEANSACDAVSDAVNRLNHSRPTDDRISPSSYGALYKLYQRNKA